MNGWMASKYLHNTSNSILSRNGLSHKKTITSSLIVKEEHSVLSKGFPGLKPHTCCSFIFFSV